MTVKSRDPSESFDFPLFFARLGGRFSVGAVSLSVVLFIVSLERGVLQIKAPPQSVSTESDLFVDIDFRYNWFNVLGGVRKSKPGALECDLNGAPPLFLPSIRITRLEGSL
jgi:hypothetical protein